jgi:hypothetical protein
VRDVFFQSDPFAVPYSHPVCFAAEDVTFSINPVNATWIEQVAGPAVLREIRDRQVSCAGTTLGTVAGIRSYLTAMTEQAAALHVDLSRNFDQGLHNYVVSKLRPDWGMLDAEDGIFNTVGCTSPERISIVGDDVLVDGKVPPVVHQWDRHPLLVQHVAAHPRFRMSCLSAGGVA